jgi:hypothetical protein
MIVKRVGNEWPGGRSAHKIGRMTWRRSWLIVRLAVLMAAVVILASPEWPAFGDAAFRFHAIVGRERKFDFITWTIQAMTRKAGAVLADTHRYLSPQVEAGFVLDYLERIYSAQALEAEVESVYADPAISDPQAATAEYTAEIEAIRRDLSWRQPLAEAIVQEQVAALLAEEGLAVAGVTWPPVMMTMSPVPYMLIASPRDHIEQIDSAALVPGLSTEDKEQMEDAVFAQLDQSALVVPIGGLGTYPAMIRETASMNWLAEVTAHEWAHHWLSLRPLGVRYLESPAMRTINETVASLVDLEIGPRVIERYYPELVPQEALSAPGLSRPSEPPAFDFGAEMAETRMTVDRLLAEGEIEAAEAYMEQRRQVFVNNGYLIRKLNQAYFAFYGGYAAEPGGAAGADPIGPLLRGLRENSPSLRDFLEAVGGVTSFEDLLALYRERVGEDPAMLLR